MRFLLVVLLATILYGCAHTAAHVHCVAPNGEVLFDGSNVEIWQREHGFQIYQAGRSIVISGVACKVEY